jgi:chromosome segregation ATPase
MVATRQVSVALGMVMLIAAPAGAFAQTERSGGGAASAQLMMQLQQLSSERTTLQAENSKLKGELEKARKERDSLKEAQDTIMKRGRGAEVELAKVVSDRARLEGELAQQKDRVQEVIGRLRETATTLRDVETEGEAAKRSLATREQELKTCVDRNQKLYALNTEVLARFDDQGFWSSLSRREPFTQLKRVELENLADGFRGTAQDNRIVEPPATR